MTDMANWITNIQPSAGSGNATVTVSMQNNSGAQRTATIRVKGNGVPDRTFTLTQNAIALQSVQLRGPGRSDPAQAASNTQIINLYATSVTPGIGVRYYTSSAATTPFNGGGLWYRLGTSSTVVMIDAQGYYLQDFDTNQNLSVSPTSIAATSSGRTVTINVTSNVSWTASSPQSWVTISGGSGSGSGSFQVTVGAITAPDQPDRTGSISVTTGYLTRNIPVNQTGTIPSLIAQYYGWSTSADTACSLGVNNPTLYYADANGLQQATAIYTDSAGNNPAPSGIYSDGIFHREWNGSSFTGPANMCRQ